MNVATVAGIACNFTMAVKIIRVNGEHHPHHFPRSLLGLFVVFLKRALYVAELALHAQRCRDELHGGNQLIGGNALEHLNILVLLLGRFRTSISVCCAYGRLRLGARDGESTHCWKYEHPYDCSNDDHFPHSMIASRFV